MKQARPQATEQATLHRRRLLGAAGTTGALAVAATLLSTRRDEPDAEGRADAQTASPGAGGYRLSEHVLRYYQTARI
jgi:hypothetical protein